MSTPQMEDTSSPRLTAVTDPALVNAYASQVMEEEVDEGRAEVVEAQEQIKHQFLQPVDNHVELPAGLLNPFTGEVERDVEVRELNGADEEAFAKIKNDGKVLVAILERGCVAIGEEKATPALLDSLLIGDRDAILLGIRRATFGDEIELKITCPFCETRQDAKMSVTYDIPIRRHEEAEDRDLEVQTKAGMVELTLPTGITQKKLLAAADTKTVAELNTMLLAGCVKSMNGNPVLGPDAVRRFGMGDRAKLIDAIVEAAPGPRFEEVKRTCEQCEKEMDLPLSLSDLFRP